MNIRSRWALLIAACAGVAFARFQRKRIHENGALRAGLHEWENEGGNLPPSSKAPETIVTTGSA